MGHAHPTSKVLLPRLRKEQNAPRLLAGAGQAGSRRHPLEAARLALHLGANGRRPPSPAKEKPVANAKPQRRQEAAEYGGGSLTTGKLNAVRAAFKAGVKPSAIARQFGISQSDVRKALAQGLRREA